MKLLNKSSFAFLLLFTGFFFTACKKEKKPICKVITVAETGGSAYNISYNADGKISAITHGTETTTLQYSGSLIIGTTNNSGAFSSKRIITLNSNNMVSNIKTETSTDGANWDNALYEYSGKQLIKLTNTNSGGGTPTIQTLTWANGNPISITNQQSGIVVVTLDYDLSKSASSFDYLDYIELINLFGFKIFDYKNEITSTTSGSSISIFSYEKDETGKNTKITIDDSSPTNSVTQLQYQCN